MESVGIPAGDIGAFFMNGYAIAMLHLKCSFSYLYGN